MTRYAIVPATQEHVAAMLPHVRLADRREVFYSSGRPIEELLGQSVSLSLYAWAGIADDEVCCIFGVRGASMVSTTGYPWMIGTDGIDRHAKAFLRRNRKMVGVMLETFPSLENFVHHDNIAAVQWLKWLGFEIHPAEPFGAHRQLFHRFTMRSADV